MYSPNGRVVNDLYSPDTLRTHIGERASANFQHWFCLFSFQELDLSAETLLKNVTPKEDEWLKIAERGLHPKAQYIKVMAKVLFLRGIALSILF